MNMNNMNKLSVSSVSSVSPRISISGRSPMAMDGMLEKIQERKIQERKENRIAYDKYWHTYSRILFLPEENELGKFIEISLSPVNASNYREDMSPIEIGYQKRLWNDPTEHNAPGRIWVSNGYSGMTGGRPDFDLMKEVPEYKLQQMLSWMKEEKVQFLLHHHFQEILSNLEKLKQHNPNGTWLVFRGD
jgi:hypothetical protein